MPKKPRKTKSPKVAVTLHAAKPEKPSLHRFTPEQRAELSRLFNHPLFQVAWNNAEMARPSLFPRGLNDQNGERLGNNTLHTLQGWEMHKIALLHQLDEPRPPTQRHEETFPEGGTIEADMARRLAAEKSQKKTP